ncbi:Dabb family protein [Zobellia alginiliquefaciens]|uniref:Dabb family protein n=1 Tax=Zobellia alginiliquefaciens TaxID=3032586 RepID=UPI0023E4465D|nr:Dabb family protein [Zobellia alginiliquefaciens]
MKPSYITFTLSLVLVSLLLLAFETRNDPKPTPETFMQKDSLLRHVVLFKFKPGTSAEDIKKVEDAFSALPSKIPQIVGYEWGLNNSPEGLNDGFTHCFFLTFNSEEDRAIYLPHPDHKAFGEVLGPHLGGVLVVDYWSK